MLFRDREKQKRQSDELLKHRIQKNHPTEPAKTVENILKRIRELETDIRDR